MKQADIYFSPSVKVIRVENTTALCTTSSDTEKFTVGSNSYTDEDFE